MPVCAFSGTKAMKSRLHEFRGHLIIFFLKPAFGFPAVNAFMGLAGRDKVCLQSF
jgi:hypothetical protein